ncbi:hypothetical protein HanRHA438_Chr09g0399431 [Helianthus annuus]|nr:hypothetical protein HanIR_Chr09g0418251 [Helianthus annuus]KAJ0888209.1 hypothetical protein HanRHA438_Chr09g0399431 [Helianthus annuus]
MIQAHIPARFLDSGELPAKFSKFQQDSNQISTFIQGKLLYNTDTLIFWY